MNALHRLILNQNDEKITQSKNLMDPLAAIKETFIINQESFNTTISQITDVIGDFFTITEIKKIDPIINNIHISPTLITFSSTSIKNDTIPSKNSKTTISKSNNNNNSVIAPIATQKVTDKDDFKLGFNKVLVYLGTKTLFNTAIISEVSLVPKGRAIYLMINNFKFLFLDQDDTCNKEFISISNQLFHSIFNTGSDGLSFKKFPLDKWKPVIEELKLKSKYNEKPPSTIFESVITALTSICAPYLHVVEVPHQVGMDIICALYTIYVISTNIVGSIDQFISSLSNLVLPGWCISFLNHLFVRQITNIKFEPSKQDGKNKIQFLPPPTTTHSFLIATCTSTNIGRKYLPLPIFPPSGDIVSKGGKPVGKYLAMYDCQDTKVDSMNGNYLLFTQFEGLLQSQLLPSCGIKAYKIHNISEWVNSYLNGKVPKRIIDRSGVFYHKKGGKTINAVVKEIKSSLNSKDIKRIETMESLLNPASTEGKSTTPSPLIADSNFINCWLLIRESTDAQIGHGKSLVNQGGLVTNGLFFIRIKPIPDCEPPTIIIPRLILEIVSSYWNTIDQRVQMTYMLSHLHDEDVVLAASLERVTRKLPDFLICDDKFTQFKIKFIIIIAPEGLVGKGKSLLIDYGLKKCSTTTIKEWEKAEWIRLDMSFEEVIGYLKKFFTVYYQLSQQKSIYSNRYYQQKDWIEKKSGSIFKSFIGSNVPGFTFSRTSPGVLKNQLLLGRSAEDQIKFLNLIIDIPDSSKNPKKQAHSYKNIQSSSISSLFTNEEEEFDFDEDVEQIDNSIEDDNFLFIEQIQNYREQNGDLPFVACTVSIDRLFKDKQHGKHLISVAKSNGCLVVVYFPVFEYIEMNHSSNFLLATLNKIRHHLGLPIHDNLTDELENYCDYIHMQIKKKQYIESTYPSKYPFTQQPVYPFVLDEESLPFFEESIKNSTAFIKYFYNNMVPYSTYHADYRSIIGNFNSNGKNQADLVLPPQKDQYNIKELFSSILKSCNTNPNDTVLFNEPIIEASTIFHSQSFRGQAHSNVSGKGHLEMASVKDILESCKLFNKDEKYSNYMNRKVVQVKVEPTNDTATNNATTPTNTTIILPSNRAKPLKRELNQPCTFCKNGTMVHEKSGYCSEKCALDNNHSTEDKDVFKNCNNFNKCHKKVFRYTKKGNLCDQCFKRKKVDLNYTHRNSFQSLDHETFSKNLLDQQKMEQVNEDGDE